MTDYMSRAAYNNLEAWQTEFLYAEVKTPGARDQFWDAVLTKTLKILDKNQDLYRQWLGVSNKRQKVIERLQRPRDDDNNSHFPTNDEICNALVDLLREPIRAFFSHPVTRACLRQIGSNELKLPFLLVIDEAAFLHQTNYMHSFMWVLDEPVVRVLLELSETNPDSDGLPVMPTNRFFVLMLGTHSQISHFAPNQIFPSERLAGKPQLLPSPFLSFNWDVNVHEFRPPFKLRDSENLHELAAWGRSMWGALFQNRSRPDDFRRCLKFIKTKLQPALNSDSHRELSILAVMSIRLHLDVDAAAPTLASQLVSSKMRWLVDVGMFRIHITTTYGSEPLLVEGAACMMNVHEHTDIMHTKPPFQPYVSGMLTQLSKGYISRGDHGELTARLLRISLDAFFTL